VGFANSYAFGLNNMMDWIASNKEWVFSGVGVAIITVIGGVILRYGRRVKLIRDQIRLLREYLVGTPDRLL
jgi:hypothetical protein